MCSTPMCVHANELNTKRTEKSPWDVCGLRAEGLGSKV